MFLNIIQALRQQSLRKMFKYQTTTFFKTLNIFKNYLDIFNGSKISVEVLTEHEMSTFKNM